MGKSLIKIKTIKVDNDMVDIYGQIDDDTEREAGYAIAVGDEICVDMGGREIPTEYRIREAIRAERAYHAKFNF